MLQRDTADFTQQGDSHSNSYTGRTPSLTAAVRNSKGQTLRAGEQRGLG